MKARFRWTALILLAVARGEAPCPIHFEETAAKAGVLFTHSFGAEKLGSLLESAGGGAVWFDYNNDGLLDLYITSGRELGKGMHPYPLRKAPASPRATICSATTGTAGSPTSRTPPEWAAICSAWPPSQPITTTMALSTCS